MEMLETNAVLQVNTEVQHIEYGRLNYNLIITEFANEFKVQID